MTLLFLLLIFKWLNRFFFNMSFVFLLSQELGWDFPCYPCFNIYSSAILKRLIEPASRSLHQFLVEEFRGEPGLAVIWDWVVKYAKDLRQNDQQKTACCSHKKVKRKENLLCLDLNSITSVFDLLKLLLSALWAFINV